MKNSKKVFWVLKSPEWNLNVLSKHYQLKDISKRVISFKVRDTIYILCIFFQTSSKSPKCHRWKITTTICDFHERAAGIANMPKSKTRNGC